MEKILSSIEKIFLDFKRTYKKYPLIVLYAVLFTIVSMIRIQMEWREQEPYNFLFNILHFALASGASIGLLLVTITKQKSTKLKNMKIANLITSISNILIFLLLYLKGNNNINDRGFKYLPEICEARTFSLIFISTIIFILYLGYKDGKFRFNKSLFIFEKALMIALIYSGVIMLGSSGVAAAFQALVYRTMSGKVYMYLGALSLFAGYMIFIGYFPDFDKEEVENDFLKLSKQPKFIEILFIYILLVIMIVLSLVLIIWIVKSMVTETEVPFYDVSGIVSSYSLWGIWLFLMVCHSKSELVKFYKKVFPPVSLLILTFGIWAWIKQMNFTGLKEEEYIFIIIASVAIISSILLLLKNQRSLNLIAIVISVFSLINVLPLVGYHRLPTSYQINRLESLLITNSMLEDGQVIPFSGQLDLKIRQDITDTVQYLAYKDKDLLPDWYKEDFVESDVFENTFGFKKTWYTKQSDLEIPESKYKFIDLQRSSGHVNLGDYDWLVLLDTKSWRAERIFEERIQGSKGDYLIIWDERSDIAKLKIKKDGKDIVDIDLKEYIDMIIDKYGDNNHGIKGINLEEMSYLVEIPDLKIRIIFDSIHISMNPSEDNTSYNIQINSILFKER
ncbi:MAG: DUF4153 domain-containing protein [Firmicutes bacterium]|jgi:hypothetical protein|nr:DUF4153 domain-containing protein [Bacillota bacterium]